MKPIATFSIVAYDPEQQEWGVAVQSRFLAVASVVSWARAGAGAIATQSYGNPSYGPKGLDMMENGMSAENVIKHLLSEDEGRELRQVGVIDKNGHPAAFTGSKCDEWAGHLIGDNYACQGNILVPGTIEAMQKRFEQIRYKSGELADWLVAALQAGQMVGGDKRGRQAAGVLVVRKKGGVGGFDDRYLDLRVDDHLYPIQKLQTLVMMHHLYFSDIESDEFLIPIAEVIDDLQELLNKLGYYRDAPTNDFDEKTRLALETFAQSEALERRIDLKRDLIDKRLVECFGARYRLV